MINSFPDTPGQHKFERQKSRVYPYIIYGVGACLLAGMSYLYGEQKGENDALETRIVGRTVDGYLADNDTYKNRRFLEVIAKNNTFRFIVTSPDLTYACGGSYKYDEGRVYIYEQKISCRPIESGPTLPEPTQQV